MRKSNLAIIIFLVAALIVGSSIYLKNFLPKGDKKMEANPLKTSEVKEPIAGSMISVNPDGKGSKKYYDNQFKFFFIFPDSYIYDEIRNQKGLWGSLAYEANKNATDEQIVVPEIQVKAEKLTGRSLDQYISDDLNIPFKDLSELKAMVGEVNKIKLGANEFVKISQSEATDETWYYTMHNDFVVSFRTPWSAEMEGKYQTIISNLSYE